MLSAVCRDNLKAIAQAYAKSTGKPISAVSKEFYGNSTFLPAFFAGQQSISIDKFDAMVSSFVERWPEEARWPLLRVAVMKGPGKR